MSRVVDSAKFRLLPCTCSRIFILVAAVTIIFIAVYEFVQVVKKDAERSEKTPMAPTTQKSPLTEIAKDVFLVHVIRDRRNRGEELRALVWAKEPNYNVECGMKSGIRMRASWYEMSGNVPSSSSSDNALWRAFYLTCNLPDVFFERDLQESLCFVEHLPLDEAPRLGFRITGVDVDYDLPFLDPEEFQHFFGLCVPLLAPGDCTADDIIEFVEINRKLGAERITFMLRRESLTGEMIAALDHYRDDKLIELVNLSLPFPASEVHNNGENVARDICLHRHMQTTENNAHPLTANNKFSIDKLDHASTRGIVRPRKVVEMGPNFAYHLVNSGRQFVIENNARMMVLYRLTEDTVVEATVGERSMTDFIPEMVDVYEEIAKIAEEMFKRLNSVGAMKETL